jgi:hypothetical protein
MAGHSTPCAKPVNLDNWLYLIPGIVSISLSKTESLGSANPMIYCFTQSFKERYKFVMCVPNKEKKEKKLGQGYISGQLQEPLWRKLALEAKNIYFERLVRFCTGQLLLFASGRVAFSFMM